MKAFEERFNEIMDRVCIPSARKMWIRAIAVSGIILALCTAYITFQAGWEGYVTLNRAVSNAAMILIGMSFMASGVCYFWDFADHLIIYRKYWGLMGFWFVCVHGFISLAQNSYDMGHFMLPQNIVAFLCALGAFIILAIMAMVSNCFAIKKLGGKRWRAVLRTGYIAYVLAIVHIVIKVQPQWVELFSGGIVFPPLSFYVTLFGVCVIILRIALSIALIRKKYIK